MIFQYKFKNLKEVVEFCEFINHRDVEVTAYIGKNQSVDAKSILGLSSFDISKQIDFYAYGDGIALKDIKFWIELHKTRKE